MRWLDDFGVADDSSSAHRTTRFETPSCRNRRREPTVGVSDALTRDHRGGIPTPIGGYQDPLARQTRHENRVDAAETRRRFACSNQPSRSRTLNLGAPPLPADAISTNPTALARRERNENPTARAENQSREPGSNQPM
jgi:hypothetical protein